MKVKEESEKPGLKFSIQKTKFMASSPIPSWQISGETMETVTEFIFLGYKITEDSDCSHKIKRCLLLGSKVMTKLDSILKRRVTTLPTKFCLVKSMGFPLTMYGCESWTIKKVEHWRIDAFDLWCWRRLLSSLDYKEIEPVNPKGNHSWIFVGRTDAEAEVSILWPPDAKNWLTGEDPVAGKDWRQEENRQQRMRWLDDITDMMDMFEQTPGVGEGHRGLVCYSPWGLKESDTTAWLNWTDLIPSSLPTSPW